MERAAEDTLFERWRRAGDPAALAEVFDRTAPRLYEVAVHLSGDLDGADDLVQTTYLAAIEASSTWNSSQPLLPWLVGILTNRARRAQRARTTRPPPPRPPADAPDPLSRAQHVELEEHVMRAIATLPPAWQPVAILHVRHGLAPTEIAFALQRSPGTVRSQLRRALQQLRAALPHGFTVAAVVASSLAGRGVAAVKANVLAAAQHHTAAAATVTPAATIATFAFWGATMKKITMAACAGLLLTAGLLLWLGYHGAPAQTPPLADLDKAALATASMPTPSNHSDAATSLARALLAPPLAANAPGGSLRVQVRWHDGQPAAGVGVDVFPLNGRDEWLQTQLCTTDALGTVALDDLRPGDWRITLDRDAQRDVMVESAATTQATFDLPPGLVVEGTVTDARGEPFAGADVWIYAQRNPWTQQHGGHIAARSDAHGRFTLRGLTPQMWIEARATGCRPSARRRLDAAPPPGTKRWPLQIVYPDEPALLVLGERACRLRGIVLDADGKPAANAYVTLGLTDTMMSEQRLQGVRRTDVAGAFDAADLPPGRYRLDVRLPRHALLLHDVELTADVDRDVTLQLTRGATLRGTVRDSAGAALAFANIAAGRGLHRTYTRSTADGSFCLEELPVDEWEAWASAEAHGSETRWFRAGAAGEELQWNPVLVTLRMLRGVITDSMQRPLPSYTVEARPTASVDKDEDEAVVRAAPSDAQGRFELKLDPTLSYALGVRGVSQTCMSPELAAVRAGAPDVTIVLPDDQLATAFVTGRIVGPDHKGVANASIQVTSGPCVARVVTDAEGRFHAGPLPPRAYRLRVEPSGRVLPQFITEAYALPARQTLDLGLLTVPAFGTLRFSFQPPDGATLDGLLLEIYQEGESGYTHARPDSGAGQCALLPGRWSVLPYGPDDILSKPIDITVEAGKETLLATTLERGRRCQVRLALPDGEQRAAFVVRGPAGELVYDEELRRGSEEIAYRYPSLGLGPHTVEVEGASGKRWRGKFRVDSLARTQVPFTFELEPVR